MPTILIADGEFDAIWDTREQAEKEKRDLRALGYSVILRDFPTWEAAEAFEDKMKER